MNALPAGYDPEIAARLAFLSNLAYDCFNEEELDPGGSTRVENFAFIVREEGGRVLVAPQGSDDIVDFLAIDAACIIAAPDDEPTFPPVHIGFWRGSVTIIDELRQELSKCDPKAPIYFGGHSMGGSLSMILAVRLAEMGYPVAGVYAVGMACPGAKKFRNYYQHYAIPTFLLVYRRDGVPFLQPAGEHVTDLIFLDARAYIRKSRESFSLFNPFRWKAWRADHGSQNYVLATAKIADRVNVAARAAVGLK